MKTNGVGEDSEKAKTKHLTAKKKLPFYSNYTSLKTLTNAARWPCSDGLAVWVMPLCHAIIWIEAAPILQRQIPAAWPRGGGLITVWAWMCSKLRVSRCSANLSQLGLVLCSWFSSLVIKQGRWGGGSQRGRWILNLSAFWLISYFDFGFWNWPVWTQIERLTIRRFLVNEYLLFTFDMFMCAHVFLVVWMKE